MAPRPGRVCRAGTGPETPPEGGWARTRAPGGGGRNVGGRSGGGDNRPVLVVVVVAAAAAAATRTAATRTANRSGRGPVRGFRVGPAGSESRAALRVGPLPVGGRRDAQPTRTRLGKGSAQKDNQGAWPRPCAGHSSPTTRTGGWPPAPGRRRERPGPGPEALTRNNSDRMPAGRRGPGGVQQRFCGNRAVLGSHGPVGTEYCSRGPNTTGPWGPSDAHEKSEVPRAGWRRLRQVSVGRVAWEG